MNSRMTARTPVVLAAVGLACGHTCAEGLVNVDLGTYPGGGVVPPNAIITTEWSSIGIVFSARTQSGPPGSLNAISGGAGPRDRYYFFTPDVFGAVGIFEFVDPDSEQQIAASFFRIAADFDSSDESAELVGLDADGAIVDSMMVDAGGPGEVVMTVCGDLWTVEWHTFGNPGIGASFGIPIGFALAPLLGDLNCDGAVDGADLGILLALWGTNDPAVDLDGDGTVGGSDLGLLLGAWTG